MNLFSLLRFTMNEKVGADPGVVRVVRSNPLK